MYKKRKKGQAALEFLTTYGWAFLVILVMIGALAYFGVLNPQKFLPDKCIFGTGFGACLDGISDSGADNAIKFKLKNGLGQDLTVTSINIVSRDPTDCTTQTTVPGAWTAGAVADWEIGCTADLVEGQRVDLAISFDYTVTGGSYTKKAEGEVQFKSVDQ